MSAGFTPGPWVVNPLVAQVDCAVMSAQGGLLPVCRMLWPTDERSEDETEASAHLIAAAPELYEALDAIMSERWSPAGRSEAVSDKARAALAKARGEQVPE